MTDASPELLKKIQKELYDLVKEDQKIRDILKTMTQNKVTHKTAYDLAVRLGELMSRVFSDNLTENALPDGTLYYNIIESVVQPMLKKGHNAVAAFSSDIQEKLNKKARVNIKAVRPQFNEERVKNIAGVVSTRDTLEVALKELDASTICFLQSIVDESIRLNADLHYRAGLDPKIIRTPTGKCCEWCAKLAGTHKYMEDVILKSDDVFRRHKYCKCIVEYDPADGKTVQNVYTRKVADKKDIEERIANAKLKGDKGARWTERDARELQAKLSRE